MESTDHTECHWLTPDLPPADNGPLTTQPGLPAPLPACCRFFLPTAAPMTLSSSSSEAPARR